MKKKNNICNNVDKYFEQMNFLVFDVITVLVAATGGILFLLGLGLGYIGIILILIAVVIKITALMFEIKDSDFDDLVNHLKEIADIDYREKIHFEFYQLSSLPIRLGRDNYYRSNILQISLFYLDKKDAAIELYTLDIKADSYTHLSYKVPYTTKIELCEEETLIEKRKAAFLKVYLNDSNSIKLPVKNGSMDLEAIIERFGEF